MADESNQFWQLYQQIDDEYAQRDTYTQAARFWQSYADSLNASSSTMSQANGNLSSTQGSGGSAASQAWLEKMEQGQQSVVNQAAAAKTVPAALQGLSNQLETSHQTAITLSQQLVQAQLDAKGPATTSAGQGAQAAVEQIVAQMQQSYQELQTSFQDVAAAINAIPTAQWQGPGTPAQSAAGGAAKGGAGKGAASGSGSGSGANSGAGSDDSSTGDSGDTSSTADQSGDQSDPSDLGGDSSLAGSPDTSTLPPPTDPTLAGSPAATLPNTSSLPGSNLSGTIPASTSPGSGSTLTPLNLTPFTPLPLPSTPNTQLPKETLGSTPVPGLDTETDGPTVANATQAGAAEASESASGGTGFYPPMMPPMAPGGARGGVEPGEADGLGGPSIRWQGQESTRAGLVPGLQGRGGQDGDSDDDPARYPSGGQVLDEELWQVSSAHSPVVPPYPGRGRSRGF